MSVLTVSPPPRNDRAFLIALAIVLAFGAAELIASAIHFAGSWRAAHPTAAKQAAPIVSATPPARVTPAPPPVASSASPSSAVVSAGDRLLEEAQALNDKGDTANALARLQEAAQREPQNAQVLAEMATIYESIGLLDRSNETWRKIEMLGPAAGTLYELAETKLKTGASANTNAMAARPNTDTAGAPLDSEGLPEGAYFGITNIATEETPDPDAETNFRLKIAIMKRPGVPIDPSKLRIMVLFYDTADDGKIVTTDADVGSEWVNPKHDWIETNPETLIVTYVRSKMHAITSESAISAAAAAITPGKKTLRASKGGEEENASSETGRRKYLGYIIRILYNDKVQTVRANPPRLLQDAPDLSAATP